jgi:CBS domain-containing protein
MQMQGKARRVRIYIGEDNRYHGKPLYAALLEMLRAEGAMGATVERGLAGFGARSRIHTANIVSLSTDLPIIIEWVDLVEQVERLLPRVRAMVEDGLISMEEIDVVQYAAGRRPDPLAMPIREVMRIAATSVSPQTPVDQVVDRLIHRGYRSLPVVDGTKQVVGIITDGDLLEHSGLLARLSLQEELGPEQLQRQLEELQLSGTTAGDIMTQPVISLQMECTVRDAITVMLEKDLKRLPVVDGNGSFAGLVSRVDLLRTLDYHRGDVHSQIAAPPRAGSSVSELMHTEFPAVGPDARLEEILQALETSRRRRVLVLDDRGRPLGIITDGDLLRRSQHGADPGLVSRLRGLVTGRLKPNVSLPAADEMAAELMTTPIFSVVEDTPLEEALRKMLRHRIKRLPVLNEDGQVVGLLGRASLLAGLTGEDSSPIQP